MPLRYELVVDDNGSATLKKFNGNLKDVEKASTAASTKVETFGKRMDSLKGIAAGAIAVLGVREIASFVSEAAKGADEVAKLGRAVGVGATEMAGLKHAAELSSVDMSALQRIIQTTSQYTADAANGTGVAAKMFKALGINVKDASGLMTSNSDVLVQLAKRFEAMDSGTERTALAVKVFGRQWREAITFLGQGSEALQTAIEDGKKFSGITDENSAVCEKLNDALATLKTVAQGTAVGLITVFEPVIVVFQKIAEKLAVINKNMAEWEAHESVMAQMHEQEQRAELRLKLTQVARLQTLQKLGYQLNANQQEFLSRTGKWIAAQNEKLGLSEKEIELETLKAQLAQKQRVNKSNDAGFDTSAIEARIAQLQKDLAPKPRITVSAGDALAAANGADPGAEAQKRLEAAQKMIDGINNEMLDSEQKLAQEYSDKMEQIEAVGDEHFESMKETLELWREYRQSAMDLEYAKQNTEERNQLKKERDEYVSQKKKELEEKSALVIEFYSTEKSRAMASLRERVELYKEAGVDEADLAKWKADQVAQIEEAALEEALARKRAALEKELSVVRSALSEMGTVVGSASTIVNNYAQAEQNKVSSKYDSQLKTVKAYYAKQIAAASGNSTRQAQLQEALSEKTEALEEEKSAALEKAQKKYAKKQQALAEAQAVINGAQGVTEIWSKWASNPVYAGVLTALEVAKVASQRALIKSQNLETGGYPIGKYARTILNENGQEFVANARATRQNSDLLEAMNAGANRETIAAMAGTASRGDVHVHVSGVVDGRFVRNTLVPAMKKYARRR